MILAGAWARARGEVRYKQGLLEARRETRVAERAGRPLLWAACGVRGMGRRKACHRSTSQSPVPLELGLPSEVGSRGTGVLKAPGPWDPAQ